MNAASTAEGLVDRHEHDDRGRQVPPQVPLEERQEIPRHQRDVRHRPEDEREHEEPEGIAPRPCQRIAPSVPKVSEMTTVQTTTIIVFITARQNSSCTQAP